MKTCGKCWTLGYNCQGPERVKSPPWESQDPSHLSSQEQSIQGSPVLVGQGLTAEIEGWDVSRVGGTPGVQARAGGAGDAFRALAIVTAALCVHIQTKADVCVSMQSAVTNQTSEIRQST